MAVARVVSIYLLHITLQTADGFKSLALLGERTKERTKERNEVTSHTTHHAWGEAGSGRVFAH